MPDNTFKIAVKGRVLLQYTNRVTRVISDDVSVKDVRAMFQRLAATDDLAQVHQICTDVVHRLDEKKREGFTKTQYRLYGEDMRQIAKTIVRDIQAANNVHFVVDYEVRLNRLNDLLDDCAMFIEYVQMCMDEGIISVKKGGVWTEKIMEVKKMAGSWKMKDESRVVALREEAAKKARQDQVALTAAVLDGVLRRLGPGGRGSVEQGSSPE